VSATHSITLTSYDDQSRTYSLVGTQISGNREIGVSQAVIAAQTNLLIPMSYLVANLKSIFILSDQNCTIKTNSSGSPQETITLVANVPFVWQYQSGVTVPFAGDVTAWYITNTPALNLKARILTS
jgi:hypothetical protein